MSIIKTWHEHYRLGGMSIEESMEAETRELRAELAALKSQEPVMIYEGRCIIDCGDAGHQDVTMLKMIPKGAKLYLAAGAQEQAQPVQQEPVGLQHVHDAITADPSLCNPDHVAEVDRSAHGCIAWIGLPKLKNGTRLYAAPVQAPDRKGLFIDMIAQHDGLAEELAQEQRKPLTDEQLEMLNFLYGAGPLDGVWFGEHYPTEKSVFWWRKHLRRVFPDGITGEPE